MRGMGLDKTMLEFRLQRTETGAQGTIGSLTARQGGEVVGDWFTMEPPWRDNKRGESCIPTGTYRIAPYMSPKFGRSAILLNVPMRDYILAHRGCVGGDTKAGYTTHTLGCILPGMKTGSLRYKGRSQRAVLQSRTAERQVLDLIYRAGDATITITGSEEMGESGAKPHSMIVDEAHDGAPYFMFNANGEASPMLRNTGMRLTR